MDFVGKLLKLERQYFRNMQGSISEFRNTKNVERI